MLSSLLPATITSSSGEGARARRLAGGLAMVTLLASGCTPKNPVADLHEPPAGRWPLASIDGRITIRQGGTPVVCPGHEAILGPAPLYQNSLDNRSHIQLLRSTPDSQPASGPTLVFEFLFEQDGYHDNYTNGLRSRDTFRGRWPAAPPSLRVEGTWDWSSAELHAVVSSGTPPGGPTVEPDAASDRSDPWLYFAVEGRFLSATEVQGTWSYAETTELGGCWSSGSGSGTWLARYNEQ